MFSMTVVAPAVGCDISLVTECFLESLGWSDDAHLVEQYSSISTAMALPVHPVAFLHSGVRHAQWAQEDLSSNVRVRWHS